MRIGSDIPQFYIAIFRITKVKKEFMIPKDIGNRVQISQSIPKKDEILVQMEYLTLRERLARKNIAIPP